MKTILILMDYYVPGFKAGGPISVVRNLSDHLGTEFAFKLICRDRDLGDQKPYAGIETGKWHVVRNLQVMYLPPEDIHPLRLRKTLRELDYDALYFNSFLSPHFSIAPIFLRWMRLIPRKPMLLAPRGEFSKGALSIKKTKKKLFIACSKFIGLHSDIIWQASSEFEREEIYAVYGDRASVVLATDFGRRIATDELENLRTRKAPGALKIVFLSRVARMKNLAYALRILQSVKAKVEFNIYGPCEDKVYWNECMDIIRSLPDNIQVQQLGPVNPEEVPQVLARHHLFVLPTLGEGFGHAILEALASGCPVLISDKTPWRDLQTAGVGWDIDLKDTAGFLNAIEEMIAADDHSYLAMSRRAAQYAARYEEDKRIREQHIAMFAQA